MLKYLPSVLSLIILISCSNTVSIDEIEREINALQKKDSISLERYFENIKIADKLISKNPIVSDSLKQLNDYFLGQFYKEKGQLDSAAVYFIKTIGYVKDSIKTNLDRFYFDNAFANSKKLGKHGDCKTIIDRFGKKIDTTSFTPNSNYYYYYLEEYYRETFQYDKALKANRKRVIIVNNWSLDNNPSLELISQSHLLKALGRKNEAKNILDSLIAQDSILSIDAKRQVFTANGILFFEEGKYSKAIINYKVALLNEKKMVDSRKDVQLSINYSNLAEAHIKLKMFEIAEKYLDSAKGKNFEELGDQTQRNILLYQLRLANESGKPISKIERDLKALLEYQNKNYKNKIESELIELKATSLKEKELLEEKQKSEVSRLKTRNRMIFIVGSLLVFIMGLFYYSRNKKLKFDKHTLQMQQRLLRSQMNPHFTFNTLYSIQNTIKSKPLEAQQHIVKFSRLLRLILENSTNNYVQFSKEIEALKKYMDLQLIRFPAKFKYIFTYNNLDEEDLIFIPPMLLQPFIENSIEHGFANLDYMGKINLEFTLTNNLIHCKISDNGVGIGEKKTQLKDSLSTKLISDYLKKETKKEISIVDKKNVSSDSGIIVTLVIPYKLTDEN